MKAVQWFLAGQGEGGVSAQVPEGSSLRQACGICLRTLNPLCLYLSGDICCQRTASFVLAPKRAEAPSNAGALNAN